MRITELLCEQGVALHFQAADKAQAVDELVERMDSLGVLADKAAYKAQILAREEEGTTGIGEGVAIPHAKVAAVKRAALVAGFPGRRGLRLARRRAHLPLFHDRRAGYGRQRPPRRARPPVDPPDGRGVPPKADRRAQMRSVFALIDAGRREKCGEADAPPQAQGRATGHTSVLAVTACPTGIAHTYMAAESLEKTAKELGVSIKVETNGSGGAKNVLTPEEIARGGVHHHRRRHADVPMAPL